jgi:hypothetical protein
MLTTAQAAELAWKNALAALEAFLRKQGSATTVPPVVTPPVVTPPTVTPQGPCGTARPYYNYYTGECVASPSDIKPRGSSSDGLGGTKTDSAASAAAANAYAVAKAAGDTAAAAIAAAGVTPSALASEESGAIGAASIAAQLRAAEEAVRISSNLARFKAAEAADLAEAQAAARTMDYDERFRFMGSSTMNNASSIVGSGTATSSPTIIVNVAGTVTAEEDLVQVVRNGLLRGQYNGQSITLEAI